MFSVGVNCPYMCDLDELDPIKLKSCFNFPAHSEEGFLKVR